MKQIVFWLLVTATVTFAGVNDDNLRLQQAAKDRAQAQANADADHAALLTALQPAGDGSLLTGITAGQVGLGNVTDDAQTKAAIVPNTAPAAGQVLTGNAGGTAYAPVAVSGDGTLSSTGAMTVTKSSGVAFGSAAFTAASFYQPALGYTPMSMDYSNAGTAPIWNQNTTGSAAKWAAGRTIGMTGPITWTSPAVDGTGNVTAAAAVTSQTGLGSSFAMSQSPVFAAGAERVSSWTNVIPYNTFTTSEGSVTSAIASNGVTDYYATSNSFAVAAGRTYEVTIALTLNSGQVPSIGVKNGNASGNSLVQVSLMNGLNRFVYSELISGSAAFIYFYNSNNTDFSAISSVKEVAATVSGSLSVSGLVQIGNGLAGHATCIKSDGYTIGYCSSGVAADGTCVCN